MRPLIARGELTDPEVGSIGLWPRPQPPRIATARPDRAWSRGSPALRRRTPSARTRPRVPGNPGASLGSKSSNMYPFHASGSTDASLSHQRSHDRAGHGPHLCSEKSEYNSARANIAKVCFTLCAVMTVFPHLPGFFFPINDIVFQDRTERWLTYLAFVEGSLARASTDKPGTSPPGGLRGYGIYQPRCLRRFHFCHQARISPQLASFIIGR